MSVHRATSIACDGLGGWCGGTMPTHGFASMTKVAIRKIAQAHGWTQVDGKDYCATCSERRKVDAAKEAKP